MCRLHQDDDDGDEEEINTVQLTPHGHDTCDDADNDSGGDHYVDTIHNVATNDDDDDDDDELDSNKNTAAICPSRLAQQVDAWLNTSVLMTAEVEQRSSLPR